MVYSLSELDKMEAVFSNAGGREGIMCEEKYLRQIEIIEGVAFVSFVGNSDNDAGILSTIVYKLHKNYIYIDKEDEKG